MWTALRTWAAGHVSLPFGPRGFQVAVGGWSLCNGLSLLLTENAYGAFPTYYRAFVQWRLPEDALGGLMLLLAGVLGWALLYRATPPWLSAALAAIGGVFWLFVGAMVVAGTLWAGVISGGGWFCVLVGVGSFVSAAQFAKES